MKYYHATTEKTMEKIFTDGAIRKSWDGCVYLCTTAVDACFSVQSVHTSR